ncbi:uncharacterized protein LOC135936098 isoform X1 [Cloeon dipterum]|uniref:uncharacterized protein LOC135936098 isoform X1 n=1 Tax=Cloeon dipterum TaxID=197152 RepID=UPI00321F99E8
MHCRGKCLQLAALLLAVACGPAAGAAVHRARGVDFITAQLIGSSVSSHVRQSSDDRPNAHFSRDAWQPVQEDRYLTSPTNRDWTDAADRSDTIHIRRRWEKKRRKGKRVARSTLWQPVELITHAKKNNSFSSRILKVDLNDASPNASDSLNGTDSGEWVQVSLTGPAPTKAAGLPRPRSTFQSPFESIISLSPEVPHLVKGFITNSHGDLMQPETLVVKYQSGGEPHIDGIYTTSPTVDGTLFGVVNSQYRPYNPPSTSQGSHYPQFPFQGSHYPNFPSQGPHYHETPSQGPHYHETPSQGPHYPETPSQIPQYPHDFVNRPQPEYNHPQHNYDPFDFQQHQKPAVPSPPAPTIYSNFDDFDDFGETLHNKPNFGTVQQVAKPTHPPTIHPLVVDAPDNHSPQMHGGNYQYQPPAQDNYAEPDIVHEVLGELIEGADEEETTRPPVVYYPTHTTSPIIHYPAPTTPTTTTMHQQLVESTYKPPTIIYGGVPSPPVSQTTSLEQNCPNVTIIVSPTITNHNVQNYATPAPIKYPSSSSYRPPNYPPPNHGGHYGYRPPSPTKPTDVIVRPPSHDTPVEEDDDVLANQEATEPPATEPPQTSSEVPPVTEPPVVTTTTVRPSILNELGQIFFNTTSPVFWLILVSPVLAMLSMLVGMTRYVIPGWRSSSEPHDHGKEVAHSIVVTKQKYKTTTKKPPKKKKRRPARGEPAGVGVVWGRSLDTPHVYGRRRRRFLDFRQIGVT